MAHFAPRITISPRRWLLRIITMVCAVLIALLICEVALRLFVEQEIKRLAIYDEDIGWRGRPNGSGMYVRKSENIRTRYDYNNLGFRDEDVTPKREGGRRVMILGDSFVENLEVEYTKTFPALVEKQLRSEDESLDVAVVGSQGYSTSQELLAFRKFQPQVGADLVLLIVYCGNDFEDNMRPTFTSIDEHGQADVNEDRPPTWKVVARRTQRCLYESSHLVFFTKNTLQGLANVNLGPASKNETDADEAKKRDITAQLLLQLVDDVQQTGADVAFVVVPSREQLVDDKLDRTRFVVDLCREHEISCLDLSRNATADDYFERDVHFNIQGHERVARTITDFALPLVRRSSEHQLAGRRAKTSNVVETTPPNDEERP